jgi:hypothetical protein
METHRGSKRTMSRLSLDLLKGDTRRGYRPVTSGSELFRDRTAFEQGVPVIALVGRPAPSAGKLQEQILVKCGCKPRKKVAVPYSEFLLMAVMTVAIGLVVSLALLGASPFAQRDHHRRIRFGHRSRSLPPPKV